MSLPSVDRACCAECHFQWEERVLFEHLPSPIAAMLKGEHRRLEAEGMPPDGVKKHAEWEERQLKKHLPPRLWSEMVRQHRKVDRPISLGASSMPRWGLLGVAALATLWVAFRKTRE